MKCVCVCVVTKFVVDDVVTKFVVDDACTPDVYVALAFTEEEGSCYLL